MIVVRRTKGGACYLAQLNGVVSRLKFSAFRLVPYHPRLLKKYKITEFVGPADLAGVADNGDDDEDTERNTFDDYSWTTTVSDQPGG